MLNNNHSLYMYDDPVSCSNLSFIYGYNRISKMIKQTCAGILIMYCSLCDKDSNMTLFFRFVNKPAMYLLSKFSLAHARSTQLMQVMKSHNKIIYTVVKV